MGAALTCIMCFIVSLKSMMTKSRFPIDADFDVLWISSKDVPYTAVTPNFFTRPTISVLDRSFVFLGDFWTIIIA